MFKGASPVQPLQFSGSNCGSETALHVAVQSNNYDLTSMLLYGAHLLLNCDDSVLDWNFPEIVWGVDARGRTPFKSGFDMIVNNLDRQPPIETLLLLCSRGVPRQPSDIQEARTRRHQMKLIRDKIGGCSDLLLKEDISMGGELKPVALNIDDNEGNSHLDLNSFLYVTKAIESRNTAIRWFDCRSGKGKQLTSFDGECTEDKRKILHRKQKMKVSWKTYCNYLTNSMGKKCVCKNANSGLQRRLEVFLTLDGRGFGVQTRKGSVIKKNEIICHYAGEIITSDEARKREVQYAKTETGSYIIEVDEQGDYCIDGTYLRSVTAFINHSCSDGNIEAFRALGNHLDANFPFIAFRAKKDIAELTELTFNYVKGVGNHEKEKPKSMCSICNTVHCLCKQCKEIRHGMHKITTL